MASQTSIDTPPELVWLTFNRGQHHMARTHHKDDGAVKYVLGTSYDEALEYIERMTGGMIHDPVSALVELRFALGDNGTRSISELVEWAKTLRPSPPNA